MVKPGLHLPHLYERVHGVLRSSNLRTLADSPGSRRREAVRLCYSKSAKSSCVSRVYPLCALVYSESSFLNKSSAAARPAAGVCPVDYVKFQSWAWKDQWIIGPTSDSCGCCNADSDPSVARKPYRIRFPDIRMLSRKARCMD